MLAVPGARRRADRSGGDPASDSAYMRCEAERLAEMMLGQLAAEGLRLRWGLMGEERARIYLAVTRRARARRVRRFGELGERDLYRIARRINGR